MNRITKFINHVDEWLAPLGELTKDEQFKGELLAGAGMKEKESAADKAKTKEKLNFLLELLDKLRKKLGLDKSDIPNVSNIAGLAIVIGELAVVIKALYEVLKSCDIIDLKEGEVATEDDKDVAVRNALRAVFGFLTQILFKKKAPRMAALFEAAGIFSDESDQMSRALDLLLFPLLALANRIDSTVDKNALRPVGDPELDDALRITRSLFLTLSIAFQILSDRDNPIGKTGKFLFNLGHELPPDKDQFPVAGNLAGRVLQMQFVPGSYFDPDDDGWHGDSLLQALVRDTFISFATLPVMPPNAAAGAQPLGYQYLLGLEINPGSAGPALDEPGLKEGGFSLSFPANFSAGLLWGHGLNLEFLHSGILGTGPLMVGRYTPPKPKEGEEESDLNGGDISFSIQPIKTIVGSEAKSNIELRLAFHDFALGISGDGRDGFLQKILPEGSNAKIKASFSIVYNVLLDKLTVEGFDGNEGLLFSFKVGKTVFGKLDIPTLYVGLKPHSEEGSINGLTLEASAMMKLLLGPFSMSVDRLGLYTDLAFPKNGDGNLGAADLSIGLKPPTGIGFLVKASVVKGGGFLSIDPDNHQYYGAGELSIDLERFDLTLKVVAIIQTQLPDGRKGFSFLLLASVEFNPAIDTFFGFKLKGAGVLVAIHRSMDLEAFQAGIKDDRLDAILFPDNPVGNAPAIVKALNTLFPAMQDRYVFALTARIGWGSRKLVDIKAGLLIEVPSPIKLALAGVIKVTVEEAGKTILKLQINFVIALDLGKKMFSIDAAIYDSKFLIFDLRGQMFVRYRWGDEPVFLAAVGGWHPDFQVPSGLNLPAKPERVIIPLRESGNPSLILSCYVAITSNTVQAGFAIEFKMKWSKFRLEAGLSVDALFHFDPFYFIVDFEGKLRIFWGDSRLAGVTVKGEFSGTNPWRIRGKATFEIWIWDYDVDFDSSCGEKLSGISQEAQVLPLLTKALQDKGNWQATMPAGRHPHVMLRNTEGDLAQEGDEASKPILADPVSQIEVMQNIAPLGIRIDKLGFQKVTDFRKYDLVAAADGLSLSSDHLEDFFAPGMFLELDDAEKLSRKSYERMKAGRVFGDAESLASGPAQVTAFSYDEEIYDPLAPVTPPPPPPTPEGHFSLWLRGNSVARSAAGRKSLSQKETLRRQPLIKSDPFVLADVQTGSQVQEVAGQKSMTEAYYELWKFQKANPLRKLQVVRASELIA